MSTSSIGSLLSGLVQSTLINNKNPAASSATSPLQQSDNSTLSPFAQLVNNLRQLQQTDPAKYRQVTGQIAHQLQTAAQTDQANGNTAGATQLNQLAADFSQASKTGQLPDFQNAAKASGGHRYHHHAHAASSDSDTSGTDPLSIISNALKSASSS